MNVENFLFESVSNHNTPVTPGLRPYCDQFFDQIALDRSKVSLRSHYGLNVVAVGRTSRRMVVLVVTCQSVGGIMAEHQQFIPLSSAASTADGT